MVKYGVANAMIMTDDIEHLPAEVLEDLDVGDTVVKVDNGNQYMYKVTYKNAGKTEIAMVYCDYHTIEELYYEKGDSGWGDVVKEVRNLDA